MLKGAHKGLGPLTNSISGEIAKPENRTGLAEGFVLIRTPREIEVTAVYRSTSHSSGFGGGVGSGIDVEVVQVRPHRIGLPIATNTGEQALSQ